MLTHKVIILLISLFLTGCAGQAFVKPDTAELKLGETTYSEFITLAGEPYTKRYIESDVKSLQVLEYAHAVAGLNSFFGGKVQSKGFLAVFSKNVLVGYKYESTYKSDSTDFNENYYSQIIKDKTTELEIRNNLGEPDGICIYPLTKEKGDKTLLYSYGYTYSSGLGVKGSGKSLNIIIAPSGYVKDFTLSTTKLDIHF